MQRGFHRGDARYPGGDHQAVHQETGHHAPKRAPLFDPLTHACTQPPAHAVAGCTAISAPTASSVIVSVRTFSHSSRENPCLAKKERIRVLLQPRTSSRTGTSTES